MIKVITSFTHHTTAEGEVISYTYSEIDDDGNRIKTNARKEFIVTDKAIIEKLNDIKTLISDRESATV